MEAPVPPISPRNSRFVTTNQRNAQPASELIDATIRHASGQIPGYAGYVRGARHYHGRTYTKVTAAAVADPRGRRDRFPAPASPGSPPRSPRTDMPGYAGFVAGSKFKYSKTRGAQVAELAADREAERAGRSPDAADRPARPLTSDEGHVPGYSGYVPAIRHLFGMTFAAEDARVDRARAARRERRARRRAKPAARRARARLFGLHPGLAALLRQLVHRSHAPGVTTCPRRLPSLRRVDHRLLRPEGDADAARRGRVFVVREVCALAALSPSSVLVVVVGSAPPALQAA